MVAVSDKQGHLQKGPVHPFDCLGIGDAVEALNVVQGILKVHHGGVGPRPLQQAHHPVGGVGIDGEDGGEVGLGSLEQLQAVGLGRRKGLLVGPDAAPAQRL